MKARVLILPGDGIGKEVMAEGEKVLSAVEKKFGLSVEKKYALIGGECIDRRGVPVEEETLRVAMECDAVLLGAVGGPKWDDLPFEKKPEQGLLAIRKKLGLFANIRPVRVFSSLLFSSPLKEERARGADLVVVRELTGGIYFGEPRGIFMKEGKRIGVNSEVYSEDEIKRIARVAFEIARKRRRKVTSVDKANVLESSVLWREVVNSTAREYPDVELNHMYVDNCAMQIVRNPAQFDVILTTNMFGDILSDESAVIPGSIGLLPSASLGYGKRGLYEPIHGSAPDIAGKGKANPVAMILSIALMFRFSFEREDVASSIERAVERVIESGVITEDLGGKASTCEVGNEVVRWILKE